MKNKKSPKNGIVKTDRVVDFYLEGKWQGRITREVYDKLGVNHE